MTTANNIYRVEERAQPGYVMMQNTWVSSLDEAIALAREISRRSSWQSGRIYESRRSPNFRPGIDRDHWRDVTADHIHAIRGTKPSTITI